MYRKRLFFYFFLVFLLFTAAVTSLQYNRESRFKTELLNSKLDSYTRLVYNYISGHAIYPGGSYSPVDSLFNLIGEENLRISIIAEDGEVLYDSDVERLYLLDNHLDRPEVSQAVYGGTGTNIRESASTGSPYYYYARRFGNYFIRAAIDYDMDIKTFLQAERVFFAVVVLLFFVMTLLLVFISGKFGRAVSQLKDFAVRAGRGDPVDPAMDFPDNELGVIGRQIVRIYGDLKNTGDALHMEKDKLIRHLYISREGVAIFTPEKKKIVSNGLFVQNVNYISDSPALNPENVFQLEEFDEANRFIDSSLSEEEAYLQTELPSRRFRFDKRGKTFSVNVIIFSDKTFEMIVNDITAEEREKKIKQELTSNIAHELRTPVSSITGYLETITGNRDLDAEKQHYFAEKAYRQALRLSELISDIAVLNRIEEGAVAVDSDYINIDEVVSEVMETLEPKFRDEGVTFKSTVGGDISVRGNHTLIYSIFQNLLENTLIHAGKGVSAGLDCYFQDESHYYFSYWDSGNGIPEKHLGRVFDRFYRIDKGRSRKSGGTGLGLAIIKNAVIFHNGEISVKNREGGGVEFLFSLGKTLIQ